MSEAKHLLEVRDLKQYFTVKSGVLTNELCQRAKKVVAVELDKRLIPVLDETLCEYDNLRVINADVMELDLKKLDPEGSHPR